MSFVLSGYMGMLNNGAPMEDFHLPDYLGKCYEIARLDHSFDKNLTNVTANYTMRADGGVRVINRGYSVTEKRWKTAQGEAYFVQSADVGYLMRQSRNFHDTLRV
jgi:apolipoprotein D and lipocalin family protein